MSKDSGKRMRKVSIWMERFWLLIAIASLIAVCYMFINEGVNKGTLQLLIFPALAGLMYAFRYTFRRRFEGRENE
jgi:uncharacterized membrane-anchored protein